MSRGGDDFLSRWSRRKLTREGDEPVPGAAPEAGADAPRDAVPDAPPDAPDQRSDAEILAELGLPDPDALAPGDDVRGFMAKAVPERLRRRALRRLWTTNPVLANLDGLVDYDDDFTDAATVIPNLATAWKVGQGYFRPEPEPQPEPQPEPRTVPEQGGEPAAVAEAAPAEAPQPEAGEGAEVAGEPAGQPVAPDLDAAGAPEAPTEADAVAQDRTVPEAPGPAGDREDGVDREDRGDRAARRSMRFSFERG